MLDDLFGFRLLATPSAVFAKAGGAPGGGGEPTPGVSACTPKLSTVPDETPPALNAVSAKVGTPVGGEPSPRSPRIVATSA